MNDTIEKKSLSALDWEIKECNDEKEIWRPLNLEGGFDQYYNISSFGRIKSAKNGKLLKINDNNGYFLITLNLPRSFKLTISRGVAMTFVPNKDPNIFKVVNHIDENKVNNHYKNLEWVTQKENINKASSDTSHPREVIQLDMAGKEIARFSSTEKAGEAIGLDRSTVSKVLCGSNQTAGGYKWKYADEKHNKDVVDINDGKCLKDIDQTFENYWVFTDGRVYNNQRKKLLTQVENAKGAVYITLPGKKNMYVGQLVAKSFIPNPNNLKRVIHINKNKKDNCVENLMWK